MRFWYCDVTGEKTRQYEATREAETRYDEAEEAWKSYIRQARSELAPFLRGKALPGDIAFQTQSQQTAKEQSKKAAIATQRRLASAGVTGGTGTGSLGYKALTDIDKKTMDYLAQVDAAIAQTIANRQLEATQYVQGLEMQRNASLDPMQANIDAQKSSLRNMQANQNLGAGLGLLLAPFTGGLSLGNLATGAAMGAISGPIGPLVSGIGGLSNMVQGLPFSGQVGQGATAPYQTMINGQQVTVPAGGMTLPGAQNPQLLMQQIAAQKALGAFGLSPQMFAPQSAQLPIQRGDYGYTPQIQTDMFGNQYISGYTKESLRSPAEADQAGLTPYQQFQVQKYQVQLAQDARAEVDKYSWESQADQARFYNAVVEALATGRPVPKPTDTFGRRQYRPKK